NAVHPVADEQQKPAAGGGADRVVLAGDETIERGIAGYAFPRVCLNGLAEICEDIVDDIFVGVRHAFPLRIARLSGWRKVRRVRVGRIESWIERSRRRRE